MNNYIQHHGIKGQKWGVRRFQNKDGSLTPAGKKRNSIRDSVSIAGHKTMAKVYGTNEKAYEKSNPTLSSMNAAAKAEHLNKVEEIKKGKSYVDKMINEEKKIVKDLIDNYDENDPDREEALALLKEMYEDLD